MKPVATAVLWEAGWPCPGRGGSWQQWVQDAVPGHLNSPGHAGCRVSTARDAHRQPGGQWHRGHEGGWGCSVSLWGKDTWEAQVNLWREGSGQSELARGDSRCRGHLTRGWSSASGSSGREGHPRGLQEAQVPHCPLSARCFFWAASPGVFESRAQPDPCLGAGCGGLQEWGWDSCPRAEPGAMTLSLSACEMGMPMEP